MIKSRYQTISTGKEITIDDYLTREELKNNITQGYVLMDKTGKILCKEDIILQQRQQKIKNILNF